ncbi:MAG: AAA family ATPase [Pleurocapsa sp. MO_192.B19]|nr:AAA family ATPase [Pleurocapsa sp. MO_192.B19]
MITSQKDWQQLSRYSIAAIKFNLVDRLFLLQEISNYCDQSKDIFFWNSGYKYLQKVTVNQSIEEFKLSATNYCATEHLISVLSELKKEAILIIEGLGEVDYQLGCQLRNFYFQTQVSSNDSCAHQIILVDEKILIPLSLSSIIPVLEYKIPDLIEIQDFLLDSFGEMAEPSLNQACFGLSRGEIKILLDQGEDQSSLTQRIRQYKTSKLARRGLRIVPKPDVDNVGGLDELERDLRKISRLFSPEARARGLRPPKGCCLWGLPGTGKSLVSKMMSSKLNATLISCDWNELLESDLSSSLAKLQYVLDVVDGIGNCVLFFDEFEKAFAGWNSGKDGGILAKMAGKLLTWMQDHESPSIMLATINHLDMLPPELIRRFQYIWFFPSSLHNGAMWEVFKIHLSKHFGALYQQLSDTQWRQLFLVYRGCSPAEIAGAVERAHDELFFTDRHHNLAQNVLLSELLAERKRFKPAITNRTTSNALAKILMEASFARPVRGKDQSRFAIPSRGLFEKDESSKITLDEYEEIFHKIIQTEPEQQYSYGI